MKKVQKRLNGLLLVVMMSVMMIACGKEEAAPVAEVAATEVAPVTEEAVVTEEAAIEVPITFVNATGVDIYALYASVSGEANWEEDILGQDILADGESGVSQFTFTETSLVWDIAMEDSEGNMIEFYGLDFTEALDTGVTITLTYDGTEGSATMTNTEEDAAATGEAVIVPVTINNNTGVDLYELYMSVSGASNWEEDMMGEDVLAAGEAGVCNFEITSDSLVWDLKMVDGEGAAIEFYGLDFSECSTDGATITLEFDGTEGTATLE